MKGICLTFNLVPRLVVYDKYQLKYDRICMYTPTCKNCIKGCHGNHAFSHCPGEFMFWNIFFSFRGGGGGAQENFFGTNEKLSWGCKVGQIRFCGIGYPISVLI